MIPLVITGVFVVSCLLTMVAQNYALKNQILEIPNERSSHSTPTPSGGGIAVVVTWFSGSVILALAGVIETATVVATLPPVFLIAAAGFVDDRVQLSAWVRLAAHFLSVAWFVLFAGVSVTTGIVFLDDSPLLLLFLCVIALVWLINLYNFMDGIDGLAGVEAIFVSFSIALFCWLWGKHEIAAISVILGAACAGFLIWNWPPAKIFMGDTGSSALGFLLGAIALSVSSRTGISIWPWIILLGVFLVDSTVTLVRRALSGQRWYEAHRSHAYQRLARQWGSHRKVTSSVIGINVCWLLPMAFWAVVRQDYAPAIAGLALLPLTALALWIGAGKRDSE